MDSIIGKWIGKYVYGNSYVEDLKGKSVPFTMDLFADGDIVRGTCIDEETKGIFSNPAIVEGTFDNDAILFYKSYPASQGLAGADLLLAKEYNSTSIQYSGILKKKFFSKTRYFEGIWEINGSWLDENGVANYYAFDGTWKMEKA